MEPPDSGLGGGRRLLVAQVAGVPAHALIAPRAERILTLAREHDHAYVCVLARILQRL